MEIAFCQFGMTRQSGRHPILTMIGVIGVGGFMSDLSRKRL
jgi:hypothetical protein